MMPRQTEATTMRYTPCRVRVNDTRYTISADGTVRPILLAEAGPDGRTVYTHGALLDRVAAQAVRTEASRLRRNRNRRANDEMRRSLGLTKTAYGGWE
jgi:hypothetical protein